MVECLIDSFMDKDFSWCLFRHLKIMALWQLLNLGTGCTVTQFGEGLHCGVTSA